MNYCQAIIVAFFVAISTQSGVWGQAKPVKATAPTMTVTDMTLLVNAATLGSQPTQSQKQNGSSSNQSDVMVSSGTSYNGNQQKNSTNLGSASVTGQINSQATYAKTKPGKYGIAFDANVVRELYQKHILNNLDSFIEAASINLNPSSKDVTELLLSELFSKATQEEQASGYIKDKNLATKYVAFANSFRQQLANADYPKIMQGDPLSFFSEITNKAGTTQCISYCEYPFLEYTTYKNGQKTTGAGVTAAFYVAYLLGYDNVWKQNDATYKALYDNYVARTKGNKLGTYQFASNRHGVSVAFKRYGVQFGAFSWIIANSGNAQTSALLWDDQCDCPDSDLFTTWSSSVTPSSFIIP